MTLRLVPTPLEVPIQPPSPRAGGVDPSLLDAFVPSATRDVALARLRQPGALAVTSGQQPGLFTGPLYTVHKALSTAALARVLERQWNRPVVPIFWAAGDDHDFAEASQAAWIRADGALATASLAAESPAQPVEQAGLHALAQGGTSLRPNSRTPRKPASRKKAVKSS